MQKLSAVIITYREARNIERCLRSLGGVADEVVVVDSFSTDETPEICDDFDVEFHQHKWQGYSEQKNYANRLAKHDWILSIDADEALSTELRNSIIEAKKGTHRNFEFNRLTNYCGKWIKHSGWYPDTKVRMFDRRETQWVGTVHEVLTVDRSTVKPLLGDLHHYSYYSITEHVEQTNKFTSLSAQELIQMGKRPSVFRMVFSPWLKFNKFYFLKLGFLDGISGLTISVISAYGTYLKYAKHYFMSKRKK